MTSIDRLLRPNRTVLLCPVVDIAGVPNIVSPTGTVCPVTAPTSAILAAWQAVLTTTATGAQHGGNISCALTDADLKLGLADPTLDTELTVCSIGNESFVQFYNVDATLVALRDKNQSDTGVFNLATQLLNAADVRYMAVDRIGSPSTTTFAVGDIVSLYELYTDVPVDVKADRGNLKISQTPIPSGVINTNYTLAA